MKSQRDNISSWPSLPYSDWKDTLDTLHMWMQIVGKVKLRLSPFLNQWWETAFFITSTGMTTGRIPYKNKAFEIYFDFIRHSMSILTSEGDKRLIMLKAISVAQFYKEFLYNLESLGISFSIYPVPVEFANPIPFKTDTIHSSYNKDYVERWWRIQLQISFILDKFRSPFRGKSSPIHFFWGSFDLAGTRFSGKNAPPPDAKGVMKRIMKYSENEENFTFGFWPGDVKFPEPAFYSYLYPTPEGCETMKMGPSIAYYNKKLSLSILPYEEVRKVKNPEKEILDFLTTTYSEYAKLGGWDINALEGPVPTR